MGLAKCPGNGTSQYALGMGLSNGTSQCALGMGWDYPMCPVECGLANVHLSNVCWLANVP